VDAELYRDGRGLTALEAGEHREREAHAHRGHVERQRGRRHIGEVLGHEIPFGDHRPDHHEDEDAERDTPHPLLDCDHPLRGAMTDVHPDRQRHHRDQKHPRHDPAHAHVGAEARVEVLGGKLEVERHRQRRGQAAERGQRDRQRGVAARQVGHHVRRSSAGR